MINSSRPSASVFLPPHLIITRNAHGAEEAEGLGTRLLVTILVPPSMDTERDRRDVSGLEAIASQITVHV